MGVLSTIGGDLIDSLSVRAQGSGRARTCRSDTNGRVSWNSRARFRSGRGGKSGFSRRSPKRNRFIRWISGRMTRFFVSRVSAEGG